MAVAVKATPMSECNIFDKRKSFKKWYHRMYEEESRCKTVGSIG
jgi:hypothetical protein